MGTQREGEREVKLVGVAIDDPAVAELDDTERLPRELRDSLTRFVTGHGKKGTKIDVTGWFGRDDAIEAIRHGLRAAKKRR